MMVNVRESGVLPERDRTETASAGRTVDDQILVLVEKLLYPRPLSRVQAIVLQEAWAGKSYREMAKANGYDDGFIRNVGSDLWRIIATATGKKVTKSNAKWLLRDYFQQQEMKG
jgi:hypothetical protein